jgi:GNAT superfamily N-acetyltransferase
MIETTISEVQDEDDRAAVRALLMDYGRALDFAICFAGFEREVEALPGLWLLARAGVGPVGVVGIAPDADGGCELKRLFVRDGQRGTGLGRRLCQAALDAARAKGHASIHLETLPSMAAALALYRSMGFEPRAAPPALASDGIIHLEKRL